MNGGGNVMILTDVGLEVEFVSETEASYYTTRVLKYVSILDSPTNCTIRVPLDDLASFFSHTNSI